MVKSRRCDRIKPLLVSQNENDVWALPAIGQTGPPLCISWSLDRTSAVARDKLPIERQRLWRFILDTCEDSLGRFLANPLAIGSNGRKRWRHAARCFAIAEANDSDIFGYAPTDIFQRAQNPERYDVAVANNPVDIRIFGKQIPGEMVSQVWRASFLLGSEYQTSQPTGRDCDRSSVGAFMCPGIVVTHAAKKRQPLAATLDQMTRLCGSN